MHQVQDPIQRREAWKTIGIFMALLMTLSAVFQGLMIRQGLTTRMLVTGVMWSPGIAALLTCLVIRRPIASLPWRWGEWRWNWYAYLLPIAYGLVMYLPVWFLGLGGGGFPNPETLNEWAVELLGAESGSRLGAAAFLVVVAIFGMVGAASRALGEEIGWRGFLIWEMRKVMPFWALGVISGLIWAVWHWPAILFTDYNAGEGNQVMQMALFTLGIAPAGIIYAYFTFRSNSLWPAVILHASHNLFLQSILTPLTIAGESTHFYIDEFGIMLPIGQVLLAIYLLRRARREGIA